MTTTITSTEFQRNVGTHAEAARREPVLITNHGRPSLALIAAEDYERLKALDTRQALYPHELGDEMLAEMDKGYQGAPTPHLNHLLD